MLYVCMTAFVCFVTKYYLVSFFKLDNVAIDKMQAVTVQKLGVDFD